MHVVYECMDLFCFKGANKNFEIYCIIDTTLLGPIIKKIPKFTDDPLKGANKNFEIYCIIDTTLNPYGIF